VSHAAGFVVACVVGVLFVSLTEGPRAALAAVFAGSVVAMLGASALYHRVAWGPRARPWMRRVDHACIYVLIAGTYTPVGLLSLTGWLRWLVLGIVWAGASIAVALKLCRILGPRWLTPVVGIAIGWVGVLALPQLVRVVEPAAIVLLAAGGLAYTAGALVYARRRPDPIPSVFGFHEVFHALTLVAVTCQYVAIVFFVVGVG
jgi:hemolysin III